MSPVLLGLLGGGYVVMGLQFAFGARREMGGPCPWLLLVVTAATWPYLLLATVGHALGRWFVRSLPDEDPHRG